MDISKFNEVGNPISVSKTKSGWFKYCTRSFSTKDSATVVREQIKQLGYHDAFLLYIKDTVKIKKKLPQPRIELEEKTAVAVQDDLVHKHRFVSQPKYASVDKKKIKWLKRPAAQRITCKNEITITSLSVMAKEKTGVSFKVRVVKASNGKLISETKSFTLKPNRKTSPKLMKLFDVKLNISLPKGSYFIFPVITKGHLAFIPKFAQENSFENGNVLIHKAMYTSYHTGKPIKYKFKTKEEKKNTYVNYGPFLNINVEILPKNK